MNNIINKKKYVRRCTQLALVEGPRAIKWTNKMFRFGECDNMLNNIIKYKRKHVRRCTHNLRVRSLTECSRQVQSSVDPSVVRHLATSLVDACLFEFIFGLVIYGHVEGLASPTDDAPRVAGVRHVQLLPSQHGHNGSTAAVKTWLQTTGAVKARIAW